MRGLQAGFHTSSSDDHSPIFADSFRMRNTTEGVFMHTLVCPVLNVEDFVAGRHPNADHLRLAHPLLKALWFAMQLDHMLMDGHWRRDYGCGDLGYMEQSRDSRVMEFYNQLCAKPGNPIGAAWERAAISSFLADNDTNRMTYLMRPGHQSGWKAPHSVLYRAHCDKLQPFQLILDYLKTLVEDEAVHIVVGTDNAELSIHHMGAHQLLITTIFTSDSWIMRINTDEYGTPNGFTAFDKRSGATIRTFPGAGNDPDSVELSILDYCSKGCSFCYRPFGKLGQIAPLDRIRKIIRDLETMHVLQVAIGGGEPLEHPDILEIVVLLREAGIVPNLSTSRLDLLMKMPELGILCGAIALSNPTEEQVQAYQDFVDAQMNWRARKVLHFVVSTRVFGTIGPQSEVLNTIKNHLGTFDVVLLGEKLPPDAAGLSVEASFPEPLCDSAMNLLNYALKFGGDEGRPPLSMDTELVRQLKKYMDDEDFLVKDVGIHPETIVCKDGMHTFYVDAVRGVARVSSNSQEGIKFLREAGKWEKNELVPSLSGCWTYISKAVVLGKEKALPQYSLNFQPHEDKELQRPTGNPIEEVMTDDLLRRSAQVLLAIELGMPMGHDGQHDLLLAEKLDEISPETPMGKALNKVLTDAVYGNSNILTEGRYCPRGYVQAISEILEEVILTMYFRDKDQREKRKEKRRKKR